jgi:hypothetical protein
MFLSLSKDTVLFIFQNMFQRLDSVSVLGTSSIDWAQLSRFYLKMETESSLCNAVLWKINRTAFLDEDRMMDNAQKPLPTHRKTETQNKRIYRHPWLECNSNQQSQHLSKWRQFMRIENQMDVKTLTWAKSIFTRSSILYIVWVSLRRTVVGIAKPLFSDWNR